MKEKLPSNFKRQVFPMTSSQRREQIKQVLSQAAGPISASTLAARFQVSRQIIVGDIALLRAADVDISATPRGYILQGKPAPLPGSRYTVACLHQGEAMAEELYAVVDNGGAVLDVTVEHGVYGQISAPLHLFSRYDVDMFLQKLREHQSPPLCALTGGVHLHTLQCPNEEVYRRIRARLEELGILLTK